MEDLLTKGYAVIPWVLDEKECAVIVDGFWYFFETLTSEWETPMDRRLPETWSGLYRLYPSHSMLFQHW